MPAPAAGTRLHGERPVSRRPAACGRGPAWRPAAGAGCCSRRDRRSWRAVRDRPAGHRGVAAAVGRAAAADPAALGGDRRGAGVRAGPRRARYGERLASHDLGLRLQARLRAWLYRQLERLVPAGLPGGDRGDLLARLICDTEEAQDLVRPGRRPGRGRRPWPGSRRVLAATALLPAAGAVLLAAGMLGACGVAAAVAAGRAPGGGAARGAGGGRRVGTADAGQRRGAGRARARGLGGGAARRARGRLGARTRAVATATGLGRAAAALAGGGGLAGVAWAGSMAFRAGRIGPVVLGVLVFLALGVAALLQGLPDALSRLPVTRASLGRLAEAGRLPVPVAGPPAQGATRPGPRAGQPAARATVALRGAAVAYPGRAWASPAVAARRQRRGPGTGSRPAGRAGGPERLRQERARPRPAAVRRPAPPAS